MARFLDILRTGVWLSAERMRLIALGILAASLIGLAFLVFGAHGLNDNLGRPLGTDFSSFYAAGTLVQDGRAAEAYDHFAHAARERAIFGDGTGYYAFQYPPVFLLVAGALALLPYLAALAVWQGVTLVLYGLSMRALLSPSSWPGLSRPSTPFSPMNAEDPDARDKPGHDGDVAGGKARKLALLLTLAFPAVFLNLGHGQNGFLTAALLTGALVLLDRRPLVAGLLIGLMIYKPQFGLMIPLVLLATGRWRVIAAAAATVLTLLAVTWLIFGAAVWQAFIASMGFSRTVLLEQGDVGFYKMQSVFAVARMWGGAIDLAYVIQGLVTAAVTLALLRLWRSDARFALKAAALILGTLLATPFCLDYDLMLLAPVIALLAIDGIRHGFAPWQKTLLAALWIVPMVTRSVAEAVSVPLAVPLLLLAFGFVLHRSGRFKLLSFQDVTAL